MKNIYQSCDLGHDIGWSKLTTANNVVCLFVYLSLREVDHISPGHEWKLGNLAVPKPLLCQI